MYASEMRWTLRLVDLLSEKASKVFFCIYQQNSNDIFSIGKWNSHVCYNSTTTTTWTNLLSHIQPCAFRLHNSIIRAEHVNYWNCIQRLYLLYCRQNYCTFERSVLQHKSNAYIYNIDRSLATHGNGVELQREHE